MLFLLAVFSASAPINISQLILGNWNITGVSISQEGVYDPDFNQKFELDFHRSEENPMHYIGEITGEDEEGALTTILRVKIAESEEVDTELSIFVGNSDNEDYDEYTKVNYAIANDNQVTFTGITADGQFSFISFSEYEAELTLYNTQTKIVVVYRLEKERPPNSNSPGLMQFLPMLMMLGMQFLNQPQVPQQAQAQNNEQT